MTDPLVTVVIPCFNSTQLLPATLKSLREQTLEDWELILVDDGSTDGTWDLIQTVVRDGGGRVKALRTTGRTGPGGGRRCAQPEVRGRYVSYLDDDDLLPPDSLERRVRAMREETDILYSDFAVYRGDGDGPEGIGEVLRPKATPPDADMQAAVLGDFWMPPSGALYSRRIVERVQWTDLGRATAEDIHFAFEAARHRARFDYLPEVTLYYRLNPRGLTRGRPDLNFTGLIWIADYAHRVWGENLSPVRRDALIALYAKVCRNSAEGHPRHFQLSCDRLLSIAPDFVPAKPKHLVLATRLLGYRRAEKLAVLYRQAKRRHLGRPS